MEDEAGNDSKILAVPVTKVLPTYKHLNEVRDINPDLLAQISFCITRILKQEKKY